MRQRGIVGIFVLILIFVVAVAGGAYYLGRTTTKPQVTETNQATPTTPTSDLYREPNGSAATANWKTYTDPNLRFSVKYPPDFEIVTEQINGKTYSRLERAFNKPDSGTTSFITISVIPEGTSNYTDVFDSSKREKLFSMRIGEEKPIDVEDDANLARFFTYERLEDISVSGILANVFQNKTPWDHPGTIEKVIFVQNGNTLYIIDAFLEEKGDITSLLFNQILSTFQVTSL